MAKKKDRRVGGAERAEKARRELHLVWTDESNPLYLQKDIFFARRYNVSRHTIYKIRAEMKIPPRSQRLIQRLRSLNLKKLTLNELSEMLGVKYQNLYKICQELGLETKPDTAPIEHLKQYQFQNKGLPKKKKQPST